MSIKNSRIGKRELVVFLDVDSNTAGYEFALASGWSRQSLLARAINAYMAQLSLPARLDTTCKRTVAVPSRKRSVRQSRGRVGKMGLAGWFLDSDIQTVQRQLFSKGVNCQIAGEEGMRLLLQGRVETVQESGEDATLPHIETTPEEQAPSPENTSDGGSEQDDPHKETHADHEPAWVSSLHDTSEMPDF